MSTLGIDASNIRAGGGMKNLLELIKNAHPEQFGFSKVYVWIGQSIANNLPARPWLEVVGIDEFDQGVIKRNLKRRKLKSKIKDLCDIIYTPGGILLNCGLPEVVVSQNMQPFDPIASRGEKGYARFRLLMLKHLMSKAFKKANGVIFLNEYIRQLLSGQLNLKTNKSTAILMGSSKDLYLEPRQQLPLETMSKPFKFLYVSTINTYKHQKELIRAFSTMDIDFEVELHLVGGGYQPYLSEVEAMIVEKQKQGVKIFYQGKVKPEEMVECYHSADGFIFSSSCENLPNILIEAMSAGLPIASSNIEPMPTCG